MYSPLTQHCDGVFVFDNGSASTTCSKVYGIKKPDFQDLNMILAAQLNAFLFPTISPGSGRRSFRPLLDTTELLFSDIRFKFASTKYVPQMPAESKNFSVESWEALESRAAQMQLCGSTEAEINWKIHVHSGRLVSRQAGLSRP